jgi:hypothetical protein
MSDAWIRYIEYEAILMDVTASNTLPLPTLYSLRNGNNSRIPIATIVNENTDKYRPNPGCVI